jgi:hypothetical protein
MSRTRLRGLAVQDLHSGATATRRCLDPKSPSCSAYELRVVYRHSNLQRSAILLLVASSLAFRDSRVFHFKGYLS